MKITYSLNEVCKMVARHAALSMGEPGKRYVPEVNVQIPVTRQIVEFDSVIFTVELGAPIGDKAP